jgi:hypothetical protein
VLETVSCTLLMSSPFELRRLQVWTCGRASRQPDALKARVRSRQKLDGQRLRSVQTTDEGSRPRPKCTSGVYLGRSCRHRTHLTCATIQQRAAQYVLYNIPLVPECSAPDPWAWLKAWLRHPGQKLQTHEGTYPVFLNWCCWGVQQLHATVLADCTLSRHAAGDGPRISCMMGPKRVSDSSQASPFRISTI